MAANEGPPLPSPVLVCDAGPIIHLNELGCLDLLADFPEVLVPEAVWTEVRKHCPAALDGSQVKLTKVQAAGPLPESIQSLGQALSLHRGEIEALHVAIRYANCLLLTDDTAARLAAGNLRLEVHGTIGVVLRAIRRGQRTVEQVTALLRSIPSVSTLHIRRDLLEEIIREVESAS